jgi:hypothetical protein
MCITILPDTPATPQVSERITFTQVRESARRAGLVVTHLITPDCGIVPSATTANETYVLTHTNGAWRCNCPAGHDGMRCWHQAAIAAEARGQRDTPNPPPSAPASAPKPTSDKQERYLAALSDLYPEAA